MKEKKQAPAFVLNYLKENGHVGKENAIKQGELFHNTLKQGLPSIGEKVWARQIRREIEQINGDLTIPEMISFCNNGIFIVNTREEIQNIRARAKRALLRNKTRMQKADMILEEQVQMVFTFDWDQNTMSNN